MGVALSIGPEFIDPAEAVRIADTTVGAVASFAGVVRRSSHGRSDVVSIEYECYVEMAEREMARIVEEIAGRYDIERVDAHHRTGRVVVGEISMLVVVSAKHRLDAFRACRALVEAMKQQLPVWKQEQFADGTQRWV